MTILKTPRQNILDRLQDPIIEKCSECGGPLKHNHEILNQEANPVRVCNICNITWIWRFPGEVERERL